MLKQFPDSATLLEEGSQYYFPPRARGIVLETDGIVLPEQATCIRCKKPRERITTIRENLETGEVEKTERIDEGREASFCVWLGSRYDRRHVKFTFDLDRYLRDADFLGREVQPTPFDKQVENRMRKRLGLGLKNTFIGKDEFETFAVSEKRSRRLKEFIAGF